MIGSGNRYCDNINRYTLAEQNVNAKVADRNLKYGFFLKILL